MLYTLCQTVKVSTAGDERRTEDAVSNEFCKFLLSCMDAAVKYDIKFYTVMNYFRYYKSYIRTDDLRLKPQKIKKTKKF